MNEHVSKVKGQHFLPFYSFNFNTNPNYNSVLTFILLKKTIFKYTVRDNRQRKEKKNTKWYRIYAQIIKEASDIQYIFSFVVFKHF